MALILKPFDQITTRDYRDLGLKVGLEIHQQLLTKKKLFCRCPAGKYTREFDAEILRHMRPTLSELGEYDGTALMEFKTKKNIIYQINHESVCTYEMDDTPPFEINRQALDIALEIALLLNYQLVGEIHIARKQYLDGSIPTGFQRTTIAGINGWIPFKDRRIDLIQLGLEEDACREVSDIGHDRVYRTDRLGMPLIEVVTRPQMFDPHEAAEVAQRLRYTVRGTGKVRTGIGAARQDVNVSIEGGARIEIKGVSRIPLLPILIYNETCRQYALLKIRADLRKQGVIEQTFRADSADVTPLLNRSYWDPIRQALQRGEKIHAVNLKGFSGMLSHPTQTGKVFSREISDRVRVIACLTRLPNILTSESTEETIDGYTWNRIRKLLSASSNDTQILVWGNDQDVKQGVEEIIIRAREATIGVPSETRQALPDGSNGFERILPGPERMYPDTDLPPLEITNERISSIEKRLQKPYWQLAEELLDTGLPPHLLNRAVQSPFLDFYRQALDSFSLPPARTAHLLFEETVNWKRMELPVQRITARHWLMIFSALQEQPALWDIIVPEIKNYLQSDPDPGGLSFNKKIATDGDVEKELSALQKEMDSLPVDGSRKQRFFMGILMKKFAGLIPGKILNEQLASNSSGKEKMDE